MQNPTSVASRKANASDPPSSPKYPNSLEALALADKPQKPTTGRSKTLIKDIPTLDQLYKSRVLRAVPAGTTTTTAAVAASHDPHLLTRIALIRQDITTLDVGAIVNAANERLAGGGGVDGAIHSAAGTRLFDACRAYSVRGGSGAVRCPTGEVRLTLGYNLHAPYVVHAVGPVYPRSDDEADVRVCERLLGNCYYKTLLELDRLSKLLGEQDKAPVESVAFSCISTGIYGYPADKAAKCAINSVRKYFADHGAKSRLKKVVFCTFLPKDDDAYRELLPVYFPPDPQGKVEDDEELQRKLALNLSNPRFR